MREWSAHQRTSLRPRAIQNQVRQICAQIYFKGILLQKKTRLQKSKWLMLIKVYSLYLENTENKKRKKYRSLPLCRSSASLCSPGWPGAHRVILLPLLAHQSFLQDLSYQPSREPFSSLEVILKITAKETDRCPTNMRQVIYLSYKRLDLMLNIPAIHKQRSASQNTPGQRLTS